MLLAVLPDDLLLLIFKSLPQAARQRLAFTCRKLRGLSVSGGVFGQGTEDVLRLRITNRRPGQAPADALQLIAAGAALLQWVERCNQALLVGSQLKAMHLSVEAVGNQLGAAQALLAVFPRALCRLVRSISSAAELPIPTTSLGMFSQLTSLESITLAGADLLALQGAAGTLQRLVVHYPARVQSVAGLPALANLRYLNLCVTPAPPHALQVPELYSLSNLQTLEIVCPAPGLDFTADLSSFACLTKLVAGDIALGGQFVFEHLTALKSLQMTCPTLAALPPHISRLTNLTSLRLTCPTLDTIPPHIKVLTNLTTLNVYADFDLSNNFDIDNLPRSLPTRIFRQEPWPHCRLVAGPAVVIA